jgi:hypothetical protein
MFCRACKAIRNGVPPQKNIICRSNAHFSVGIPAKHRETGKATLAETGPAATSASCDLSARKSSESSIGRAPDGL